MEESSTWWIDAGIYLSYFLLAIALIAAVVLPLFKSLGDPKSLITSIVGVVLLLVVFGICYALSSSSVPNQFTDPAKMTFMTPSSYQLVGGSIVMCYVLLIGTAVAVVYSEVVKMFK
jgi:formate-dependent nitrite reductase membrane component NrfD